VGLLRRKGLNGKGTSIIVSVSGGFRKNGDEEGRFSTKKGITHPRTWVF